MLRAQITESHAVWYVSIMLWPFALTTFAGGLPLVLSGRRTTRRAREDQCPTCGYDLKGLTAGTACPECGKGK